MTSCFCVGTGSGQPTGIFTENGGQCQITAAASNAITADELINLIYTLKAPYRRNAKFLMGVMYKAGGQYDDSLTWNDELLPICPNMIGGILLFPSSITEQADNLYLPSTNLPVAYASNDVNATANTKRGSMNLVESEALSNGYKFV